MLDYWAKGKEMAVPETDGSRDFDFEIGSWSVQHRRLKLRLKNCTEWEVFLGQSSMQLSLSGQGNLEQNIIEIPGATYHAIAIRAFDTKSETWAIWWLDGRDPHHLDEPVIGRFSDGVGEFRAVDTIDDQRVLVRLLWLRTNTETPRWEQAMSIDDGVTWETNWVMDFTRV